jgi:hypothetical protein
MHGQQNIKLKKQCRYAFIPNLRNQIMYKAYLIFTFTHSKQQI